jgi:hypothetical protein
MTEGSAVSLQDSHLSGLIIVLIGFFFSFENPFASALGLHKKLLDSFPIKGTCSFPLLILIPH